MQQRSRPRNNVRFQLYVGAMRDELLEAGHDFAGEEDVDIEVWKAWSATSEARPRNNVTKVRPSGGGARPSASWGASAI